MKINHKIRYLIIIFAFFAGLLCGCETRTQEIQWDVETESVSETEETESETKVTNKSMIYVDICGAVASPGVYALEEGARVYQAIDMAGGLLRDADDTMINRAEVLSDGSKIRIYSKEETAQREEGSLSEDKSGSQNEPVSDGKVNLNTADIAQLVTLPGIGETRAADIISYRTEHGSFSTVEEVMNVAGIKEGTFKKIKDKITVE